MTFRYQGTWAHLNGPIMEMRAAGLDFSSIAERLQRGFDARGRYNDIITVGTVRFIVMRNLGTWRNYKPKRPEHWEIWTPESQYTEIMQEQRRFSPERT